MTFDKRQQGLSLVELMVAIVVSLILLAGVIQIFFGTKQSYRMQEAQSRLQENGRFAVQLITQDARVADFWGCHGDLLNVSSDLDVNGDGYIDFTTGAVGGTDGGANPDTLILQGAHASAISVVAPFMANTAATLVAESGAGYAEGDILMVGDCISADIFQVTEANPNGATTELVHSSGAAGIDPGNGSGDFSRAYQGDARIYRMRQTIYSVQNGAYGGPSLFRSENGSIQELVEGVEDMQVLYGEDTDADGSANRYVAAGTAGLDFANVVSLRVTLVLRTEDDNLSAGGDGRVRHTFTTTVTIRNRVA